MTLQTSGVISSSQINVELQRVSTAEFNMNGADERELAANPSGAIFMSDFYGKSWVNPGATSYTSAGAYSFVVPRYNTITIQVWGGGGAGGAAKDNTGATGGQSSCTGLTANGGVGGQAGGGGGSGGTASGGATNTTGGSGSNATGQSSSSSSPITTFSGSGGNAPSGGSGGAGSASSSDNLTSNGYPGGSPGGGGGGSLYKQAGLVTSGKNTVMNYSGYGGGGGGSGGYSTKMWSRGDVGAPTVGGSLSTVVGAAAPTRSGNFGYGGAGGAGRVTITWS